MKKIENKIKAISIELDKSTKLNELDDVIFNGTDDRPAWDIAEVTIDLDNKNRAVFFQVEGHGSSPSFKNTLIDLQASLAGTRFENSTDFNYDTTENDAPSAYAELIENALIRVTS